MPLNGKDDGDGSYSEARAARAVGGRYRIMRRGAQSSSVGPKPAIVAFGNDLLAYHYCVEHRPPGEKWWRDVRLPRGLPGTLAEAKRVAEEDHEVRRLRGHKEPIK